MKEFDIIWDYTVRLGHYRKGHKINIYGYKTITNDIWIINPFEEEYKLIATDDRNRKISVKSLSIMKITIKKAGDCIIWFEDDMSFKDTVINLCSNIFLNTNWIKSIKSIKT